MVVPGVETCRSRALGNDHDKAGAGHAEQRNGVLPVHIGQPQVRKPANDRPDDGDATPCEIPSCARGDCAGDSNQRARHLGSKPVEGKDACQDHCRDKHGREVNLGQATEDPDELSHRLVGVYFQADHLAQHGDAYLKSHAGEKPDQHRLRQEVGQEAELEHSGQQ